MRIFFRRPPAKVGSNLKSQGVSKSWLWTLLLTWSCNKNASSRIPTQNRPRLCLHFRIIKRASNWPKRTHVDHFSRLRQAGPQNASNSIFKRRQRNLLDNSSHSKEAQTRIRQASTPNANKGQLTRQTHKPPRHVNENVRQTKHMVDCNDVICTWRICPWRIFRGGQICNSRSKIPRMSISTALWKRSLKNAMKWTTS